jgi:hypothetical protein
MVLHPPLGTATVTFVSFALQTTFGHCICVFQLPVAEGELVRARTCFAEARERLSAYAPAQGHLTELDAVLGDVECAIVRLRPFASACDDPDYAAQLAKILENAGDIEEARGWCAWAASRYDALLTLHIEALADHADPERALRLAKVNLKCARPYALVHSSAMRSSQVDVRAGRHDV